jgi:hypothetical protein
LAYILGANTATKSLKSAPKSKSANAVKKLILKNQSSINLTLGFTFATLNVPKLDPAPDAMKNSRKKLSIRSMNGSICGSATAKKPDAAKDVRKPKLQFSTFGLIGIIRLPQLAAKKERVQDVRRKKIKSFTFGEYGSMKVLKPVHR